jgi:hypothetical protein
MRRFRSLLSIISGKNARLMLLPGIVAFNVPLWLGSSFPAYLPISSTYGDIPGVHWESGITWIIDPGFHDPATDVSIRVISIVVVIVSVAMSSGGIIGVVKEGVTTLFNGYPDRTGKIVLDKGDRIVAISK